MQFPSTIATKYKQWIFAILLLALPLIYFYPAVLGKVILAPGDGWTQILGIRILIGQMISQGILPLWNPYIFAGMPLLATIQPGALYPPTWFFALFEPQTAMNIMVITTYHVALIGTYLYARRVGQSRLGATIAALSFTFGGYMISHLGHTNRIAAAAWLPWILLAIETLQQQQAWRWIAAGACFIALQLFAGEPQMTCYTVIVTGAYALANIIFRTPKAQRLRYIGALACMGICGALLSAVQLLPEREILHFSERASISYEYFSQFSLPPQQILGIFFPYYFGGAATAPYQLAYWGRWNSTETAAYVGMAAWLFAFTASFQKKKPVLVLFWLFWAFFSLLLTLGDNLPFNLNHILHHIPVYNLFRAPGRHLVEFNFAIGVLAGFGATLLEQAGSPTAWRNFKFSLLTLSSIVIIAVSIFYLSPELLQTELPIPAEAHNWAVTDIYIPVLFFLLSTILLTAYIRRPTKIKAVLIIILVFLDACSYGHAYEWKLPDYNVKQILADAPTVAYIKQREQNLSSFRILSQSPQPFKKAYELLNYPNNSIARGLQSVNGYDPVRLTRTTDIAGRMTLEGWVEDTRAYSLAHRGYDLLNVKYLLCEGVSQGRVKYEGIEFDEEPSLHRLEVGLRQTFRLSATTGDELAIVSAMGNSTHLKTGMPIVGIEIVTTDGKTHAHQIQIGRDTAEWAYDRPSEKAVIKHSIAKVVESWPIDGFEGHRYLARFKFDRAQIERIEMTYLASEADITISRASIFDSQTGASSPLASINLPAERWQPLQKFESVTLYENKQFLPRAWFVRRLQMTSTAEVLQAITTGKYSDNTPYDPREVALFEKELYGKAQLDLPQPGDPTGAEVNITNYEPQRIQLETRNAQGGFLVLSEIYYRGWDAYIDGKRVPVERVNYALRGLSVPAGQHRIEFVFRSPSFQNGLTYSGIGAFILLLGGLNSFRLKRKMASLQ